MTTAAIVAALEEQAEWCDNLGSPLNARLLTAAAGDMAAGGIVHRLLHDFPDDPTTAALALRLTGALHHAVLSGRAAELARYYPSAGGRFDPARDGAALWEAARGTLEADPGAVRAFLAHPPQTNEVARSGILLGGFLEIARHTGLPLALREIGASAGLNLLWDRFHYQLGVGHWGHPQSPVTIACDWDGATPDLRTAPAVASRTGCDPNPLPIATAADRLWLEAYIWPDQTARLERLRGAMALAVDSGVTVERAHGADWVTAELAPLRTGEVTVVYHSIVMQYLAAEERQEFIAAVRAAGERATPEAPVAWLALEPIKEADRTLYTLELTVWPDGQRHRLADRVHPHGGAAHWL